MNWHHILFRTGVSPTNTARWAPIFADQIDKATFSKGADEIDDFLGQVLHESAMLSRLEENLNYSADRLCVVWPSRFPSPDDAAPFARNPQALANKVYGGRLGNKDLNDGWQYRGSGLIQCTGKDNFRAVGEAIGIDLVSNPDLLRRDPATALKASIAWWEGNVPDSVMGDIKRVTKRVNGGTIGIEHRAQLTDKAGKVLG